MSLYRGPRRILGAPKEDPTPLNWRRGFFRIWALLSGAWIMGWIIYLMTYAIRDGIKTTGDLLAIPVILLGPPVALFIFGVATAWAFRGFVVEEPAPPPEE
jgi:hypothetical protein